MLKKLITVSLFVFSLMITHLQANEKSVDELAQLIKNLISYKANFKQSVRNEYGEEIDSSSGLFAIQKPNHFRWEIKEKFAQLIIADGEHLWTYDKDLEQVTIQNQSKMLADSPLLFLTSGTKKLSESFIVTQPSIKDDKDKKLFMLKPKDGEGVFDSVHVLFDKKQLTEIFMKDTLGQQTTISFSDIQLNSKLDIHLFTFQIPEGVDVVDSREFSEKTDN